MATRAARKVAQAPAPASARKRATKKAAAPKRRRKKPVCPHCRFELVTEGVDKDGDPVEVWRCIDCAERTSPGVELEVMRDLRRAGERVEAHGGLAASALTLARALDGGAGLSTAAIARELRTTLDALGKEEGAADGDRASALLDRLLSA